MKPWDLVLLFVLLLNFTLATSKGQWVKVKKSSNTTVKNREGKVFSLFQVIRFPNSPCVGTSTKNGTCYSTSECSSKGGVNSGSCANGFGVCCTFTFGCGATINQNSSYFDSTGSPSSGQCGVNVCKASEDICQLRIDMNTFVIAGPNTITTTVASQWKSSFSRGALTDQKYKKGGVRLILTQGLKETTVRIGGSFSTAGSQVTMQTQCNTDTFSVGGSVSRTTICGTNSGHHIYVGASPSCNLLVFQLGQAAVGTTIPVRSWSLKILQISCNDLSAAPPGCTHYFYGSTTGFIQSFNYANSIQIANQNEVFCVRRERNYCRICWSTAIGTDFAVSGNTANMGYVGSFCCGYGNNGMSAKGFDCVQIPGATKFTGKTQKPNSICGRSVGLATATNSVTAKTVCSMQTPFQLSFVTDNWTMANSAVKGFRLYYWLLTC